MIYYSGRGSKVDRLLEQIAKKHLPIDTLKTRGRDSLDFHDVAVWGIRDALAEAYIHGRADGIRIGRKDQR